MLHKLNTSSFEGWPTLRSIVSHCENPITINSLHRDSFLDWIVVSSNIFIGFGVILADIPSGSIVQDSLLHFETIWIGEKCLIIVKIMNFPFGNDFITIILNLWKTININIKLDSLTFLINLNMYNNLHLSLIRPWIYLPKVQIHNFLAIDVPFLVLTILLRLILSSFRSKNIITWVLVAQIQLVIKPLVLSNEWWPVF